MKNEINKLFKTEKQSTKDLILEFVTEKIKLLLEEFKTTNKSQIEKLGETIQEIQNQYILLQAALDNEENINKAKDEIIQSLQRR